METDNKTIEWLKETENEKNLSKMFLFLFLLVVNFYGTFNSEKVIAQVCVVVCVNYLMLFLFAFLIWLKGK